MLKRMTIHKVKPLSYTTESELEFISGLGTYSKFSKKYEDPFNRLNLLIKYKQALMKRERWGSLDKETVLKHLDTIIQVIQSK